jgi:pilus assembly protein TadC
MKLKELNPKKFKYVQEAIFIAAGAAILVINFLYVSQLIPFLFPILNILGGIVASVPTVWLFYSRYRASKEMEQQFITFIRDLSDSIKSGMTLPMALNHCSKRDYTAMTKHVRRLAAQIEWGIPFSKALRTFANKTNSVPVKRAVATIIATYKIGGKISDTLDSVSKSLATINKIKKERTATVYSQVITSYIIFFVFIVILVILQVFIIPNLTLDVDNPLAASNDISPLPEPEVFDQNFIAFIIVQGLFAGLATGKMAEGSLAAGLKHSILLIISGYGLFSIATSVF